MQFLIVGLGSIGRRHAKNLYSLGYKDISVVRTKKRADSEQEKFFREHKPKVFYDLRKALKEKPDVVLVTNPTNLHLQTAEAALESGAHLFIEKPISHTMRGVSEFLKRAKKMKRIVYVGYNFRHHPHIEYTKKLLDEKKLGTVFSARFITGEYLPGWHPWEDYRKGYAARKDLGGGMLLTQSHDIDTALYFFGLPKRVHGSRKNSGLLQITADDIADLILEYPHGTVSLHIDGLTSPPIKEFLIYGTKGNISWDYHKGILLITIHGKTTIKKLKNFDRNSMYIAEIKEFISCIRKKKEPMSNGKTGAEVLALTEKIMLLS